MMSDGSWAPAGPEPDDLTDEDLARQLEDSLETGDTWDDRVKVEAARRLRGGKR